jgi:ubiquitin carboxyl-terminal hydrolase 4/11/15
MVTSAAYLLFYRRRSSAPLGGPRFTEIFSKFDNPNEGDDSSTEVGDEQSDDSFGRAAASSGRALNSRNGTTTTIRPVTSFSEEDEDDDDGLPPYSKRLAQSGAGDEGVEMADQDQFVGSNPITQAWSFGETGSNHIGGSDCASDTVQVSSEDDRTTFDQDIEMNSAADNSDTEKAPASGEAVHDGMISVPAKVGPGNNRDSEEVAEIHLDGDKETRNE